jgi:hypothetical protein
VLEVERRSTEAHLHSGFAVLDQIMAENYVLIQQSTPIAASTS